MTRAYGNPSFLKAKHLAQEAAKAHSDTELLWGLFAELSLYCHGPTSRDFLNDMSSIHDIIPLAADVIWNKVRAIASTGQRQQQETTIEGLIYELAKSRASAQNPGKVIF